MLAVGGLLGDAIRCIAVKEGMEDEHLANRLVSHLMVIVQRRGYPTVKVFTKPSNKAVSRAWPSRPWPRPTAWSSWRTDRCRCGTIC